MKAGPDYNQNNEKKIFFFEFGGSRKSEIKADFCGKKDPICFAHYLGTNRTGFFQVFQFESPCLRSRIQN